MRPIAPLGYLSAISLRIPFSHALIIDWDLGKCVLLQLLHSSIANNFPKMMPGSFCLSLWHFCFAVPRSLFCFYHDIEHQHEFAECYIINIMLARPNSVCLRYQFFYCGICTCYGLAANEEMQSYRK